MERYDIIIIGAGVVGCAIAFHLADCGAGRVLLIERDDVASGTSARSSAVIRMHYSVAANAALAHAALAQLSDLAAVLDDTDATSGFHRAGYMIMAGGGTAADNIRAIVARQQDMGIDVRLIDAGEALDLHPMLALTGIDAIAYEAGSGYAVPYLTASSFARAARRRGVAVRTGCAVRALAHSGTRISGVVTDQGRIDAGTVIVAANVWTPRLLAPLGIDVPVRPVKHRLASFRGAVHYDADLPVVKDMASDALIYVRPEVGGLALVGTGDVGEDIDDPDAWDETVELDHALGLGQRLAQRMPTFADAGLARTWAGLYDVSPDWNPILGPVEGWRGLVLACGFSGHGFKLSPVIGRLVAQAALGVAPDYDLGPYRLGRFAAGELLATSYGAGSIS